MSVNALAEDAQEGMEAFVDKARAAVAERELERTLYSPSVVTDS